MPFIVRSTRVQSTHVDGNTLPPITMSSQFAGSTLLATQIQAFRVCSQLECLYNMTYPARCWRGHGGQTRETFHFRRATHGGIPRPKHQSAHEYDANHGPRPWLLTQDLTLLQLPNCLYYVSSY